MYFSFIFVKISNFAVSFQIIIAFVNNVNMIEDKNDAIIYKMAIAIWNLT